MNEIAERFRSHMGRQDHGVLLAELRLAADILDEAEKALAGIIDRAQFIGEPDHDADAWAEADSNARATLARIRGEQS
jgi:hypothetical protein